MKFREGRSRVTDTARVGEIRLERLGWRGLSDEGHRKREHKRRTSKKLRTGRVRVCQHA